MGLDTFPLLQDQTYLIAYRNTVFKLKLEYQHVSEQIKEAFAQVVSERTAHCQIEDVCRAVLYNIEREEPISPIQSEHFVIYPEVHRWPLANKVQFFVHGKQLSCHQNLILLKLVCKGYSVSVPDQNQVEASSSSKPRSPRPSHDTSQAKSRGEELDKNNTSTSCPGDTNTKKSSTEIVSGTKDNAPVCDTLVVRLSNITEFVGPDMNYKGTTLPQQQHCSKISSSATDDEKCPARVKKSYLETSLTETVANNVLTDKNKHKKTVERSLRGRYDHNVSRRKKHQVHEISPANFRQSSQQAPELAHSMLNNLTTLKGEQVPQSEIPYSNSKTEHLYTSDLQTYQDVHVSHSPGSPSTLYGEQSTHDQHEVIYERNSKVMPKRITRSELRKRYVYNNLLREGFRKSDRRCVASQINRKVTSINSHQSHMVKSEKTNINSTGLTQASKQKYTCGRNKPAKTCDATKRNMKHTDTCDDMKQHSSLEISDKDVVEVSMDGKTLYESKKIIDHGRDTPVSPYVTLRNRKRKQNNSAKYPDDTNRHQVCGYRSQSAESGKARRISDKARRISGKARRLSGQVNSTNIVNENRQIEGHDAVRANRSSGDSSQISVRYRRIATKYNFIGEQGASQTKYKASFKEKVVNLEAKEKVLFDSKNEVDENTGSRGKSLSCDSLKRVTRSHSVSSLSGETDMTSRSSQSRRKVLYLAPKLSTNRGNRVPDALAEAHQHLLEAKDGVWLFWKSRK